MDYEDFKNQLMAMGATEEDVVRLNLEGMEKAFYTYIYMYADGFLDELDVKTEKEFQEFCYQTGRELVMENLNEFFITRKEN